MRAVEYAWSAGEAWADIPEESRYSWDEGADERVEPVFVTGPSTDLIIRYDNGQLCTFRRKPAKQGEAG